MTPASSFSAGPPIRIGRELTAAEERHIIRRRRQERAMFVGVVLLVPLLGSILAWVSQSFVDARAGGSANPARVVAADTLPAAHEHP